jgi:predicted O-methyltransferase YrrM
MGQINQDYIEDYLRRLLPRRNELLTRMEQEAEEVGIPIVQPEVAQFLEVMVKSHGFKRILEVGTAMGYSAIRIASVASDIKMDTMELNPDMIRLAEENLKEAGLKDRVTILEGDAAQVIQGLHGPYDLIFLDGAKGHYVHMLEDVLRLLAPHGMILSDNVLFRGMVASNTVLKRRKITIVKRMRRFLEMISADDRLETSILPLGDGVAVTIWKQPNTSVGGNNHE